MVASSSASIHLGTSAFIADGWERSFYPKGMKPADYLTYYATKFDTVEIDSTFYHAPSAATVNGWARKTPDNFSARQHLRLGFSVMAIDQQRPGQGHDQPPRQNSNFQ